MPSHRLLEDAAKRLNTTVEILREFAERGWITIVKKNGNCFVAADQQYKARFILDLQRRRKLNTRQIDHVLAVQKPPYSMLDVDRILAEI